MNDKVTWHSYAKGLLRTGAQKKKYNRKKDYWASQLPNTPSSLNSDPVKTIWFKSVNITDTKNDKIRFRVQVKKWL